MMDTRLKFYPIRCICLISRLQQLFAILITVAMVCIVYESYISVYNFNYSLLFVVGKPRFLINQEIIEEEGGLYGDILQMDFTDTYRNITLKHLAELRYLASACNDNIVILKVDDDVAWDIQQISTFVRNNITLDNLFCVR
ncbi:unnamed protein product [Haemonchus placei]|uniref:Hexosyltransferase n=1 Tax=Haemonchus placei TaxID=6290 RepID=A0A0N4X3B2_HAEPC|nr:unnamed protein product [Haemonchus placei]